jgi:hypothetical protein
MYFQQKQITIFLVKKQFKKDYSMLRALHHQRKDQTYFSFIELFLYFMDVINILTKKDKAAKRKKLLLLFSVTFYFLLAGLSMALK